MTITTSEVLWFLSGLVVFGSQWLIDRRAFALSLLVFCTIMCSPVGTFADGAFAQVRSMYG